MTTYYYNFWEDVGECDMKRFTWWRMEQDAHHLSRALCGAVCSILHHVKRFMSQPPNRSFPMTDPDFRLALNFFLQASLTSLSPMVVPTPYQRSVIESRILTNNQSETWV